MADPFHLVRAKWAELPIGNERFLSTDLARLSDAELVAWFQTAATFSFARRTWRYVLYSDAFRGKRILDVGSGTGSDAVTFAKAGAEVTCLDLHASNLELIDRLARLWELPVETVVLEDFTSIDNLRGPFDVILGLGLTG